jgi:hypothetical protein
MISSPVPWRPACASPCCSWRRCGCARSSAYCRRRTPPPPGRSPWQPAAFAWQPTAFDAWSGLPLRVEDVDLHTTKRRRRRSPLMAVAERRARRGGGASACGSVSGRAGTWWLLACWGSAIPGAAHEPDRANADASRRRDERSALTRTAAGSGLQPISCRTARGSRRATTPQTGRRPPMIGRP